MREAIERSAANNALRQKRLDQSRAGISNSGGRALFNLLSVGRQRDINRERSDLEPQLAELETQRQSSMANVIAQSGASPEQQAAFATLPRAKQEELFSKKFAPNKADSPSAVREFEFFNKLTPQDQQRFINIKRADPLRAKGLVESVGGDVTVKEGFGESVSKIEEQKETGKLTAKAKLSPAIKKAEEIAKIVGKEEGIAITELDAQIASFPNLQRVAAELSELGKTATFTKAGQAADIARRELGLDVGQGAVARSEYIAKIDNEILPLLRQTFGAQFTENEGKSLKATLGDVNKSPEEKDAILKAFIAAKAANIKTKQRQVGAKEEVAGFDPTNPLNAPIEVLPQGATQIGTSGGKPVFQTPDGKTFIQD